MVYCFMIMGFYSEVINKLELLVYSILVLNNLYFVGFLICNKKIYLVYLKGNNGFKFDFILLYICR